MQKVIIDAIPFPVVLISRDYIIVHCNSAALKAVGMSTNELISKRCYQHFCHCSPPRQEHCPVLQTLTSGKPVSLEKTIAGIDYQVSTIPIFQNGQIIQVLESFIDITEVNKSKELLRRAAQDAEEAAKAKSLFLATMSHELRTPLNAVIGFTELLKLGEMSPEEQADAITSIHLSGTTLLSLINDVLDLSKLEAGQMSIIPERSNLHTMIRELNAIFEHKVRENNLSFVSEVDSDLPFLYLDHLRLRQVLLNLIGNAVKFTHKGGITIQIQFKKEENTDKGVLSIQIRDTGIGIAREKLDAVFEPFVQDESRRGSVYQGTGLGLPICKRLVEQMNGKLTLQSVQGKGSCFTVTLPDLKYEGISPQNESSAQIQCQANLIGRVLLVDDVPMNLKVLQAMARKLGLETQTAASGKEALQCLEQSVPDLLFTDMWMPGMNGAELAHELKQNPNFSKIPLIAVTADTEVQELNRNQDFDDILLKPVSIEKLRKIVETQLHRSNACASNEQKISGTN